jgi:hypothetical protein
MVLLWHMDEQARRIERLERVLAAERGEWALDGIDLLSVPCDRCAAAAGDRCHSPPNRYGTVDNYSLKNTHKVRKLKALKAAEAALRGDS